SQKFIPGLTPYWAVAEKNCLYNKCWKKFKTIWQGNGTLGERLYNIYNKLIKKYSYVILIGADCPELSTAEFVCASGILQLQSDLKKYVIGKTYDGGFYLFGANFRISKNIWTSIPYSHPQTAKLLTKKLDNLQAQSFQLRQLRDIDTIEDALYYLCQTPYY
ncbi:MAG: DUF2064 domain-containing protein, partial [Deltaproteobacteria bacterium]|nr:DUF2064 domain-containing protein [Deltaproteobacteria bacterium]